MVRWGSATQQDFDRVVDEVASLRKQADRPLLYIGIMPEELGRLDDDQRRGFMKVTENVLPHCGKVCVAVEAKGFRGAIMRSAMTTMILLTKQWKNLVFVDSVEAALEHGQEFHLNDYGAMLSAIEQVGAGVSAPAGAGMN